jgi:hypothetical protein
MRHSDFPFSVTSALSVAAAASMAVQSRALLFELAGQFAAAVRTTFFSSGLPRLEVATKLRHVEQTLSSHFPWPFQ